MSGGCVVATMFGCTEAARTCFLLAALCRMRHHKPIEKSLKLACDFRRMPAFGMLSYSDCWTTGRL